MRKVTDFTQLESVPDSNVGNQIGLGYSAPTNKSEGSNRIGNCKRNSMIADRDLGDHLRLFIVSEIAEIV